ncbi:unnamed protein product [Darwinula stevensoni]|uniref:Uncharacterized protein n=1 Tax=Darwinula stevensoni TaxID=69355 RepID=A0A7R9FQB7_9CRUS|nr:unnamed protein product [Darwinula stevensoni]CAG0898876.1 unnamed protein product [Darwinula stevensoni]
MDVPNVLKRLSSVPSGWYIAVQDQPEDDHLYHLSYKLALNWCRLPGSYEETFAMLVWRTGLQKSICSVEKRALLDVTEMIIKAESTVEEKEAKGMIICIDRELNAETKLNPKSPASDAASEQEYRYEGRI